MMIRKFAALCACAAILLAVGSAEGARILTNGTGGGDWEDVGTWDGPFLPIDGDQVQILAGDTVTITEGDDPFFYFWDEPPANPGGGTVDVTPTDGTPSTIWVRGTNQKFDSGILNINKGAFMRVSNATGSAQFGLRGNARMNMAGLTEWFSDNDDARIGVWGTSELTIRGSEGEMAVFGQADPGVMGYIQVFENGVLDAEYAQFGGTRGVFMHDGAQAGASIHIKDSIFTDQVGGNSGATIFNENVDKTILIERTQFTNQPVRALLNKSRLELIDVTIDDGWTLGDLVIFSGSVDNQRWVAMYPSDGVGDYEIMLAPTAPGDPVISYQAFQVDPTEDSDVFIHPDLAVYSPRDGHESSIIGTIELTEDAFANSVTLAEGITFDLNGFTLSTCSAVDENGGTLLLNGGQVLITCAPSVGDANGDGLVDDADLSLLLANWGQDATGDPDGGVSRGEFNLIAPVDDADLSLLLSNWTGAGAVPEPATLGLIAMGIGLPLSRRRRA